ncbi:hypothetical protein C488_09896 [Natrinema pellirubrum DSM 15624]|uniref:Transcriptional regulator n=1 Tax=Natrinema pellirubrum (strain DSM 15624 / CIP 106293 / JCM 10476 / NCIMB 786 / 157) TaxID=797303 RepID=L0JQQ5_NATP1|nr:PadR family transcriptional regulator [Natrinema pellirubrum]AGB32952.1 putative transcriptional regulator [Natrinema pellirubrum DSM 15624]ELY75057.1 hypothetical protein C488_09896 [Natrinema pellirubrum DSM 15624]
MESNQFAELGVLGVLAEEPADTETVRERLRHNFSRYWTAGYGALEPTVERLREVGHVTAVTSVTEAGRRETEYAITDNGRERLRTLLNEPIPDDEIPMGGPRLVLTIGFLHHLPTDERRDRLAALIDRFERARSRWHDVKATHEETLAEPTGYRRDLQDLAIRLVDTYCQWLTELWDELEAEPQRRS